MFTSRSWQTRLERIDSDAVLWSSIFSDIIIRDKKKRVKFYSEGDSKYFFFISSDHNVNINRFSPDGIMIG